MSWREGDAQLDVTNSLSQALGASYRVFGTTANQPSLSQRSWSDQFIDLSNTSQMNPSDVEESKSSDIAIQEPAYASSKLIQWAVGGDDDEAYLIWSILN